MNIHELPGLYPRNIEIKQPEFRPSPINRGVDIKNNSINATAKPQNRSIGRGMHRARG